MKRATIALLALALATAVAAQDQAPESFEDLLTAAQRQMQAQQYDHAQETLAKAIEVARTDEDRASAIFTLAASHEAMGDRESASEVLERALELQGGGQWLDRCLQRLGALADRLRDMETARRAWERLVEVRGEDDPTVGGLLIELGRQEREAGDLDRAAEHLRAVLAHDAHQAWHDRARESLCEILLAQGEYEEALAEAREWGDAARRQRLEVQIADRLVNEGEFERGREIAREVLAASPEYTPAMRVIYRAATRQGEVEDLRQKLRGEADGEAPEGALIFLAEIARWEDDGAGLLDALERLTKLRPDDPDLRVQLGDAALDAGRLDEAEAALRKALEPAPDHRGALTTLAEVLVQRGNTDEAVDLLKHAVNFDPADSATVRSLDYALRRHSLHHERVKSITAAREATGFDTLMAYELAQAYIDLLRYDDATRELLAALKGEDAPARAVAIELEQLVADDIAGADVLAAVRRHVETTSDPPHAERLALARVLLAAGDRERAAGLLEGAQGAGMAVADLAAEAQLRGDDELATSLYAMALEMAQRDDERAEIALRLARLQRERGDWRGAFETLAAAPLLDAHPEALLIRAELLTHRAHRLDEARDAWRDLLAAAGGDPTFAAAAREGMADWLFASGRLEEAEQAYAELAGDEEPGQPWGDLPPLPPGLLLPGNMGLVVPPEQEASRSARAALQLAEIALRRGDLENAQERFRFVVAQHAQTQWTNDALDRLAFIRDNLDGSGGAEQRYFEALGLLQRGDDRMARDLLLEIAGTRDEPLADDALVAVARLREEQGDAREAAKTWLSVSDRFPESLMAPQALLSAAAVLRDELDDPVAAGNALRRVVEDYPDSAAATEARARLELLPPPRS